ncbi:FRIGIDA-like protein 5 [Raphanus sativus]|uniref:FRIGIDA-like protein n=1 Tax=Raphanus sativus TaxID=3726 RepID=A0A6J0N2I5_RAPSA|nr:FRIGIDA-like protein 5 [Raphanus sativus]KAJ4900694.1 FRIGIDA-like protein 5 [Raphanus sativus]
MGSLMEKAMSQLRLVDLSKQNFKRTLDSLQDNANSLIHLSIQWKEIEGFFDSTKTALEERAKELQAMEESVKVRGLELEAKEESAKVRALELEAKEESVKAQALELEAKEESVKARALELEAKEESVKVRALELEAKEESVKVRGLELEAKEESVKVRALELEAVEESVKVRALELEAKEKEIEAKVRDLEKKKEEALGLEAMEKRREEFEEFTRRIESVEKVSDEKVKELDEKAKELDLKVKELQKQQREGVAVRGEFEQAKELELKVKELQQQQREGVTVRDEFEPLVSLLAKKIGSSVSTHTDCSTFRLSADDLVKRNEGLARMIQYLEPAKLVLDAVEGCFKEDFGEAGDSVVNSCVVLLEKLILMKLRITQEVRQEATQLGFDWMVKVKTNPNNDSLVFGWLLFIATYGWASGTTREMLSKLLDRFLLYEQAPRLFRRLGLEDNVSGVIETLKKKNEHLAALRFICEFHSSNLCQGWRPRSVLHEFLQSLRRIVRVTDESSNLLEAQKAKWEKRKADAAMALDCIREKKAESIFNANALKDLALMAKNDSAPRAAEPVHKSCEQGQNAANAVEKSKADSVVPCEHKNEAKRQRLTEPITPFQNSTVKQLEVVPAPSGEKIEELVVNHHQPDAKATEINILSRSTNAETLRKLLEKQPPVESDLSNAIKSSPDPAKLVLDTSMALCTKNPEGGYDFNLLVTSDRCLLLLDQLKNLPLQIQIGHPVKDDAKKLAVHWKDKISKSKTDELEVVCFLKFLGIFGIVSEFKANDLLALLDSSYWQTVSPDLCQFLELDSAIPGFIQNLIRTGYRLKAVNYIYSFGMVHRFQPVSAIIKDSLRITKECAEKSYRDANNESAPQVAAIDRQIKSLRAAIRCISCHKLESEFQPGDLEGQIKSLFKRRRNLMDGSNPASAVKQSQTALPPNSAEVGSVTSNTPSEPSTAAAISSANKPGSTSNKKRGQKRSFSENKQSSVHIA